MFAPPPVLSERACIDQVQTLRFVKSLPKRERQPLKNKFKNADPTGMHPYLCKPL